MAPSSLSGSAYGRDNAPPPARTPSLYGGAHTPRLTPRMTPVISGADEIACSTYDAYIGVHDAVQTLEERTQMALNAMEAIEEAINISVDGTQANRSVPGTPGQHSTGASGRAVRDHSNTSPVSSLPSSTWPTNSRPADLSGPGGAQGESLKGIDKVSIGTPIPTPGVTPPRVQSPPHTPIPSNNGMAGVVAAVTRTNNSAGASASDSHSGAGAAAPASSASSSYAAAPAGGVRNANFDAKDADPSARAGVPVAEVHPPSSSTVRMMFAGDHQNHDAEAGSEERRPGQAKYREQSVASAFSEAESIAACHLQGY